MHFSDLLLGPTPINAHLEKNYNHDLRTSVSNIDDPGSDLSKNNNHPAEENNQSSSAEDRSSEEERSSEDPENNLEIHDGNKIKAVQEKNKDAKRKQKSIPKRNPKNKVKRPNQKFCVKWLSEFKWARDLNGKTKCTICETTVSGGGFHLRRHANSSEHRRRAQAMSKTLNIKE